MFDRPRLSDYEHGVLAVLDVIHDRVERHGDVLNAANLEIEIRSRCLKLPLMLRHDEPRSR